MAPDTIVSPVWGKAVTYDKPTLDIFHDRRFLTPLNGVEAPTWELPSLVMSLPLYTITPTQENSPDNT